MKTRTNDEFRAAIDNAAPENYDGNPQLAPAGAPSTLERMIIRPGESGGLFTRSEFDLAKFCTEKRLRKKTSDRLIRLSGVPSSSKIFMQTRYEKLRK